MKRNCIIFIFLILSGNIFADNIKTSLEKTPITSIPFDCTKCVPYLEPTYAFPTEKGDNFPLATYNDLGLTQKNADPNTNCVIFRKFKPHNGNFDLLALDLTVSDLGKKILVTYHEGKLIDYIEAEVSWFSGGIICVKQWHINANEEIVVTWLKVESSTPILAFSNFNSIHAQRIDIHCEIDSSGKFQEIKQVKYQPQTYTKAYLTDKNKNLWEGNEPLIQ